MMPSTHARYEMNLSAQLASSLRTSQITILRLIADFAAARGFALYAVGGLPRDILLNRLTRDFDLIVESDAIPFARSLAQTHGGRVTVHDKFHTATWHLPPHLTPDTDVHDTSTPDTLDIISARSETYAHPAALPTVTLGSLTDDLRRRDFTINALAIRLDGKHFGELRDDLNVQDDLNNKFIRVLHDKSFDDDPTRIFRAARYASRLKFTVEPHTNSLITNSLSQIEKLSAVRVRHELEAILEEPTAADSLTLLAKLSVLSAVHPSLKWDESARARLDHSDHLDKSDLSDQWLLWFMSFSSDEIASLNKRLHFPAALTKDLLAASTLFHDLPKANQRPSEITFRLDTLTLPAVRAVALATSDERLQTYLDKWRHIKPHTTGDDLKKRGLPPGPKYAEILSRLRSAWLDGEVVDINQETKNLDELLKA